MRTELRCVGRSRKRGSGSVPPEHFEKLVHFLTFSVGNFVHSKTGFLCGGAPRRWRIFWREGDRHCFKFATGGKPLSQMDGILSAQDQGRYDVLLIDRVKE